MYNHPITCDMCIVWLFSTLLHFQISCGECAVVIRDQNNHQNYENSKEYSKRADLRQEHFRKWKIMRVHPVIRIRSKNAMTDFVTHATPFKQDSFKLLKNSFSIIQRENRIKPKNRTKEMTSLAEEIRVK